MLLLEIAKLRGSNHRETTLVRELTLSMQPIPAVSVTDEEVIMRVGFIGLGDIGMPMAKTLLAAGFDLTVYNRSRGKVEEMEAAGRKGRRDTDGLDDGNFPSGPICPRSLRPAHPNR